MHRSLRLLMCFGLLLTGGTFLIAPTFHQDLAQQSPTLRFSTYLGGSDIDLPSAIAIDDDSFVYVTGVSFSDDFPTQNAAMSYQGGPLFGADVFVAKLTPGGETLVYATYLGGSMGEEMVAAMAVDDQGRVFVAGTTNSLDFPTRNSGHGFRSGNQLFTDAFVARLSADGSAFDFVTYLGGTGDETATALALSNDGSVYVTGTTTSTDFPTTGDVFQPDRAGEADQPLMDAFIAKLTPDGDAYNLNYATYLGGLRDEIPKAMAVDAEGQAWVAGVTTSDDFPTQDALQTDYAGPIRDLEGDVFLTRLTQDGSALDFSTYLGGGQSDQATGLALGDDGTVYLTGSTMSNDFPTTLGAWQTGRQGLRERFVDRLVPMGGRWMLDESTRLGTPGGSEMGRAGLALDRAGRVWIAGATASEQFLTREAEQSTYGGGESDAFLARVDASGSRLGYASYLGGSESDVVTALALGEETLCLTGGTGSADFPTQAALQPTFDGPQVIGLNLSSAFVTCFDVVNEASVLTRVAVAPDSVGLIAGEIAQLTAEGFDQFEQAFPAEVTWTATGGTIDENGRYTAGDDAGFFTATATDLQGGLTGTTIINIFSGVGTENGADVPDAFALHGNYPNPFNPQTTIHFDVKTASQVVLTVYDALGRKQATLLEKDYSPGHHEVRFDGRGWPSGTYFYMIEMGDFRAAQKMVLLR